MEKNNFLEMQDYINYICDIAAKHIKKTNKNNYRLIDGIGEVNINGNDFQIQIQLEPHKSNWVDDDKPTFRVHDEPILTTSAIVDFGKKKKRNRRY